MNASEFAASIKKATSPLKGSFPTVKTYRLAVKKRYEGMSILDFYTEVMPSISRKIWSDKILSGNLKIEGLTVSTDRIVRAGEITIHTSKPLTEPDVNTNIELIEWNDDFIILNKPAPLPMHPGGRFEKNTLIEFLKNAFPKEDFKLVHRIDANTTGIIVIAKNKKTANALITQFQDQKVQKEYLTLAEGIIPQQTFVLEESISKEITASGGRKVSDKGKISKTEFKVINTSKDKTLLSVIPHSGRTNQIRIHLANINHPIVGDKGYKNKTYFENNPLTYTDDCLFLHAWKITFILKNKQYTYKADIPDKFINYPIIKTY